MTSDTITHPCWDARPEDTWSSSNFSICTMEGAGGSEWDKQHPHPHGDERERKKGKVSLHKAGGFLVGSSTCLLSITPSALCTKPTLGCILQQTLPNPLPNSPGGTHQASSTLVKRAGSTSMQQERGMRQGELQWWRQLDHNQAPFQK